MVTGIESFKEWFKGNESQYAIIGGTACDILMTEEGLDFRATKDIDLVLIIEAVDAAFERKFWDYAAAWEAPGRELHKAPVSLERQGLLRLLPEADEISCTQEAWPLV